MPNTPHNAQQPQMKQKDIEVVSGTFKEIQSVWEHLQHVNWDKTKLDRFQSTNQELITFSTKKGLLDINATASLLAKQLETVEKGANQNERAQITTYLTQLLQAVNHLKNTSGSPSSQGELPKFLAQETSKIAIIEDDKAQAEFLRLKLELCHYLVETYDSPSAFADDHNRTHFDLIIMDVSFPDGPLEGLFWLESIQEQLHTYCPIIITSARSDFVARMRAVRAGASAYISKPFDINDLKGNNFYADLDIKAKGIAIKAASFEILSASFKSFISL